VDCWLITWSNRTPKTFSVRRTKGPLIYKRIIATTTSRARRICPDRIRRKLLGKQFVQQLDSALHLTPEQRVAIAKIVADGQERNHEIWTNVAPQMHKVLQDVRQLIREQLAPEQRKQFEEW